MNSGPGQGHFGDSWELGLVRNSQVDEEEEEDGSLNPPSSLAATNETQGRRAARVQVFSPRFSISCLFLTNYLQN